MQGGGQMKITVKIKIFCSYFTWTVFILLVDISKWLHPFGNMQLLNFQWQIKFYYFNVVHWDKSAQWLKVTCDRNKEVSGAPEMCGKLSAVECVTTNVGEDTAGSVVSAVHTLCLQLKMKLQWSFHHHLRKSCLPFKRSWAERVCLCSHVNKEPIGCIRYADLHGHRSITIHD